MPDDPTGRPKPTTRRRRQPKSAASASAAGVPPTADPNGLGVDPTTPTTPVIEEVDAPAEAAATVAVAADTDASSSVASLLDDRSPNEWVCPFLRSTDESERLNAPMESPDVANRCAALEDVVPQSLRQQELVCLTTSHVNCPRYLRGAVATAAVVPTRVRTTPTVTPAMFGALVLLAAAFTASVVFTFARGGLDLGIAAAPTSPAPSASSIAVVPSASPAPTASVEISASPIASPAPSASVEATPSPTATAAPTPTPEPSPSVAPSATPSSDRYELLTACPDKPDCWIYRVRSGDNLFSIAKYFGVPLATVKALNPWTQSGLKVGRDLILPPPTR
jgi:LysM repeat protein